MAKQTTTQRGARQTRAARERATSTRQSTRRSEAPVVRWNVPWGPQNLIGIGIGIVVIVIGYLIMSGGIADDPVSDKSSWNNTASTVIAPILLTLAYCVIIPVAIFWRPKGTVAVQEENEQAFD